MRTSSGGAALWPTEAPVAYTGEIVVGHPVSGDVTWLEVPNEPRYGWAYLGDKRVVIDRQNHQVVAVY